MNKVLSKITKSLLVLSLAFGVAIFTTSNKKNTRVDAADAVAYTLDGTVVGTKDTYAGDNPMTQGSVSWLINGNIKNNPWKIGGNKNNGLDTAGTVRHLQSQNAVSSENITKVVISTSKPSSGGITPTNVSLKVGTSIGGSQTSSLSNGSWAATVTFNRPSGVTWSSKYFEIDFTMPANTTTTNKYISFLSATFYYESNVTATSLNVGAISTYPGHTATVSVTPSPNGSALPSSLSYSSSNTSVFTVSDGIVTGVAAGTATLRVESTNDSSVYGTATVTVNAFPTVSRVTVNGTNKYAIYATSSKSGSSLNYSLNSTVSGGVGPATQGESGSVNISNQFSIISGLYPNTIAIRTSANKYFGYTCELTSTGNNELHLLDEVNEYSSWVVTSEQLIPCRSYGTSAVRNLRFNYTSGGNTYFACYISTSTAETYVPVSFYEIVAQSLTGISVNDISLYQAHEKTLSVLPVPAQASLEGATYTFASSDTSVAEVDENGVVTALSVGTSTITTIATISGTDYSTTSTVTVNNYPAASGITLNDSYVIATTHNEINYELTGIDTSGSNHYGTVATYTTSTSNTFLVRPVQGYYTNTVAFEAVDGSGYLKTTQSGNTLGLNSKIASNSSWVVEYSNNEYTVTSAQSYGESQVKQILFNYNSGNPRISSYGGLSNNNYERITFLSASVSATDFTLSKLEVTIYKTQTHTLEVSFTPNNTTDRTLSWSTSDSSVATVSDGVITAVGPGTATISASKSIGGNTVTRSCDVTVLNNVPAHAGTSADPYDVNDAVNIAKGLFVEYSNGDPVQTTGAYVRGIVTNLSYKSTSSITFWIGDDLSQTNAATNGFEIYSPSTIMRQTIANRYSSVEEIDEDFAIGTTIVASGDITLYQNTTAEFAAGSNVVLNNRIQAKEYATVFNNRVTNGVCDADGATDPDDLVSAWTTVSNSYSSLDLSTKALFLDVAEDGDENGSEIEHAIATYDYILKKYNTTTVTTYADFMGRVSANIVTLSSSSNKILVNPLFSNENTNLITIIVIISLVSITSIGGYFFIRKRKVN